VAAAVPRAQPAQRGLAAGAKRKLPKDMTFRELWFSDPGTYPVIAIIGGACLFWYVRLSVPPQRVAAAAAAAPPPPASPTAPSPPPSGAYYTHNLATNQDIRIMKGRRGALHRDWDSPAGGHH